MRLHTACSVREPERCVATIEHLAYSAGSGSSKAGWRCETIVDGEAMSREDALFIARSYAQQNNVPVIYECHSDLGDRAA